MILCHVYLLNNNKNKTLIQLNLTNFSSIYFLFVQIIEYNETLFTSDFIFGTSFYIATEFHGIQDIFGTLFLIINLVRII